MLECNWLFPGEQMECQQRNHRRNDPLYIKKRIFKEVKTRRKNVIIASIDNKTYPLDYIVLYSTSRQMMELACLLVVLQLQCRSILCLHLVNVLSLWCFYRVSLLLLRFLLVGRMLVGFVPSFLCEWNRRPW